MKNRGWIEASVDGIQRAATAIGAGGAAMLLTDLFGGGTTAKIIAGSATTVAVGGATVTHAILEGRRLDRESDALVSTLNAQTAALHRQTAVLEKLGDRTGVDIDKIVPKGNSRPEQPGDEAAPAN